MSVLISIKSVTWCSAFLACEAGEDLGGRGTRWGRGVEVVAERVDGHVAQWPRLLDDAPDADTGAVLEVAGDDEGGEHDSEVRLDRARAGRTPASGKLAKTPKDRLRKQTDLNPSRMTILKVTLRAYRNGEDLIAQFEQYVNSKLPSRHSAA